MEQKLCQVFKRVSTRSNVFENKGKVEQKSGKSLIQIKFSLIRLPFDRISTLFQRFQAQHSFDEFTVKSGQKSKPNLINHGARALKSKTKEDANYFRHCSTKNRSNNFRVIKNIYKKRERRISLKPTRSPKQRSLVCVISTCNIIVSSIKLMITSRKILHVTSMCLPGTFSYLKLF